MLLTAVMDWKGLQETVSFGETIDYFERKERQLEVIHKTFCQALGDLWAESLLRSSRGFYYSARTFKVSMNHSP